jgi:cell division protein FtsL
MTIIKLNQNKDFYLRILIIFLPIIIIETTGLIFLYNQTVTLNNEITQAKVAIQGIQGQSAEINNQIFDLFASQNVAKFVDASGLVVENNPQYVETNSKWAFASQY